MATAATQHHRMEHVKEAGALGPLAGFRVSLPGAGAPPTAVKREVMGRIADVLSLGHVARAIRESWGPAAPVERLAPWVGSVWRRR